MSNFDNRRNGIKMRKRTDQMRILKKFAVALLILGVLLSLTACNGYIAAINNGCLTVTDLDGNSIF